MRSQCFPAPTADAIAVGRFAGDLLGHYARCLCGRRTAGSDVREREKGAVHAYLPSLGKRGYFSARKAVLRRHSAYAERRARPLRRRRARTLRPVGVAARERYPCVRARLRFFGCHVRFIRGTIQPFPPISNPAQPHPILRQRGARAHRPEEPLRSSSADHRGRDERREFIPSLYTGCAPLPEACSRLPTAFAARIIRKPCA